VEWKRHLCASSEEIVKNTFLATTQLVPSVQHENEAYPKDHHVTQFPILSHRRLKETVYADPVEYEVNGSMEYALFVACRESKVWVIYPLGKAKTAHITLDALYDFVCKFGVPQTLYSDYGANCNKSVAWKKCAQTLVTAQKTSEPHHHESNYVERSWQTVKQTAFNVMHEAVVPFKHTFHL
jgi:hypothetical protein